MARKQAETYESKRRNILASAAAVIAEHGLENASMSLIAEHGNVSKALLYHYYDNKSALIFDIVHSHMIELDRALELVDEPASTPDARFTALILEVLNHYKDYHEQHKVQLNCISSLTSEQKNTVKAIERKISRRFSEVILLINKSLDDDRHYLMPTTMSLFGILNWVYLWFRDDGTVTREEYAALVSRLMLHGVHGV